MSVPPHILLVDDEAAITANLAPFLERAGFRVSAAADGRAALAAVRDDAPDLIVLDVLLPLLDGRAVLRSLRRDQCWLPVILLTQVGDATERAMAIEEGADDYLNKPFDPHELTARIKAVLRRARPHHPPLSASRVVASGAARLDRLARRLWVQGAEVILTPKALALLDYLMTHPDEAMSRERLLDAIWGWEHPVGTRAVDTRIAELRRALKDDSAQPRYIETIPGHGYRFVGAVEPIP